MFRERQQGSDARLIMIFQEVHAAAQELRGVRDQMLRHRGRIMANNMIVELLVVGEIEAERLQARFEVPINLSREQESWMLLPNRADRFTPKLLCRCRL